MTHKETLYGALRTSAVAAMFVLCSYAISSGQNSVGAEPMATTATNDVVVSDSIYIYQERLPNGDGWIALGSASDSSGLSIRSTSAPSNPTEWRPVVSVVPPKAVIVFDPNCQFDLPSSDKPKDQSDFPLKPFNGSIARSGLRSVTKNTPSFAIDLDAKYEVKGYYAEPLVTSRGSINVLHANSFKKLQ